MNCASGKNGKKSSKKRSERPRNKATPKENPQKVSIEVEAELNKDKTVNSVDAGEMNGDDDIPVEISGKEIDGFTVIKFEEIGESCDDKINDDIANCEKDSACGSDLIETENNGVETESENADIEALGKRENNEEIEDNLKETDDEKNKIANENENACNYVHDNENKEETLETSKINKKTVKFGIGGSDNDDSDNDDDDDTSKIIDNANNDEGADSEMSDTGPPFTKYVEKETVMNGAALADDTEDQDMQPGEEIVVQYLKGREKKNLKATLRMSSWSIDHPVREMLWRNMCKYLHKADDDEYTYTMFVDEIFPKGSRVVDVRLPSFVDCNHVYHYYLNTSGITAAKKILCVLEHSCPDIIYSPMLFSLLSLFLHYMDVSQCYNCLYALSRTSDCSFLTTTKVSFEATKLVMRDLAKKYAKGGYVDLVRNSGNIDAAFDTWIWWILEDLPLQYLVHVIDCFLHEGFKIFYRVTLAILILFHKTSTKKSNVNSRKDSSGSSVVSMLRQFCREMPFSVEKLLKTGFSVRGLNRREIRKLQVKHEMYVTSKKNIASYNEEIVGTLAMSRSFSGPIVLQNLGTNMLTPDMLYAIWTWLPTRYAVCQPQLLYTSEEHGTSLVTLYQRVENYQPTIIVIKTTEDEVFGAFCSSYWRDRRQKSQMLSYFGTGETFIFTLSPEKKKYDWVGLTEENIPNTANMFQAGDMSILTVGGGHGEAIALDEQMLHCRSEKCDTFNNPSLSRTEDFNCKVVEVYGFQ